MRRTMPYLMAVGLVLASLAGGCSTIEDSWDEWRADRRDRSERRLDLNNAARRRLAELPGISREDADRIVANRPYETKRDLVRKRVLSESQFDRVRDSLYVDRRDDEE